MTMAMHLGRNVCARMGGIARPRPFAAVAPQGARSFFSRSIFGSPGTRPLSAPVRPPTLDFDFLRGSSRWGSRRPPMVKFLLTVGGVLLLIAAFDTGTDFLSTRYAESKLHELEGKEKEESPEEMYSRMSNTLNEAVEKMKKSMVK